MLLGAHNGGAKGGRGLRCCCRGIGFEDQQTRALLLLGYYTATGCVKTWVLNGAKLVAFFY